jgi:hypothetical protein
VGVNKWLSFETDIMGIMWEQINVYYLRHNKWELSGTKKMVTICTEVMGIICD